MNTTKLRFGLALLALGGLAAAMGGCGGDDDGGTAAPTTKPSVATKAPAGDRDDKPGGEAKEIVVSLTENAFAPNAIVVEAGKPVTFVAKNAGEAVHNMKILSAKTEGKDYSSSATIAPGKDSRFTVTFSKKGTVKFQCDYHLPDMVGTIEVK